MSSPTPPAAFDGPEYAEGNQAYKIRAQKIIAHNDSSQPPCTICIQKNQLCYRNPAYGKCAYCTAREFTKPLCHLPDEPGPPRRDRRKRKRCVFTFGLMSMYSSENSSSTPKLKDEHNAANKTKSPVPEQDFPVPDSPVLDIQNPEISQLQGITAAQGAHIEQLSKEFNQLVKRVNILESSAAHFSANSEIPGPPFATQSAKVGRPRRLDPSAMHTVPVRFPYEPAFRNSPVAPQIHLSPSPPRPTGYRPLYTELREEEPDGTLPEHTISHVAGFTPVNCSCGSPHTLKNGDTMSPRDGFT